MLALDNQIAIEKQQVLHRIGYDDEGEPSNRIDSLVNDYIENYHDLIAPSYSYNFCDIKWVNENRVGLDNSIVLKSKVIATLLSRCEIAAFFVLTIGSYLEDMVAYLAKERLVLQATVLDAIGSGTAEKLANQVEEKIKKIANTGNLITSRRFSPGYCDWKVNQQEMVFRALSNDTGGVRLTDSLLMMPRKSISGIIGIGLPGRDIENYNPCITCKKKECPGRRK
jgi:hypothetical protein